MSLELLVNHPVFAELNSDHTCLLCHTPLVGTYSVVSTPRPQVSPLNPEQFESLCVKWINKKGISIHKTSVGIIDVGRCLVYAVDFLGEKDDRPALVLAYYSEKMRGQMGRAVRRQALDIGAICKTLYSINPFLAVVNVYGDGKIEGSLMSIEKC